LFGNVTSCETNPPPSASIDAVKFSACRAYPNEVRIGPV